MAAPNVPVLVLGSPRLAEPIPYHEAMCRNLAEERVGRFASGRGGRLPLRCEFQPPARHLVVCGEVGDLHIAVQAHANVAPAEE